MIKKYLSKSTVKIDEIVLFSYTLVALLKSGSRSILPKNVKI